MFLNAVVSLVPFVWLQLLCSAAYACLCYLYFSGLLSICDTLLDILLIDIHRTSTSASTVDDQYNPCSLKGDFGPSSHTVFVSGRQYLVFTLYSQRGLVIKVFCESVSLATHSLRNSSFSFLCFECYHHTCSCLLYTSKNTTFPGST